MTQPGSVRDVTGVATRFGGVGRPMNGLGRMLAALAVAAVFSGGLAAPAAASEVENEEASQPIAVSGRFEPVPPDTASPASSFWPSGLRDEAYVLSHSASVLDSDRSTTPYDVISRVAVPAGEVVAAAALGSGRIGGWVAPGYKEGAGTTAGGPQTMALDEGGNRLFVAYWDKPERVSGHTLNTSQGRVCSHKISGTNSLPARCVGGVLILDATTLQQVGRVDLRNVGMDAAPPQSELLAMTYAPPRGPGDPGKLLMHLMPIVSTGTYESLGTPATQTDNLHAQPQFVVQIDPDSQRVDWVLRLDACRGNRNSPTYTETQKFRALPHHSAVYRSTSLSQPSVVVGCRSGAAWTGNVVVIPLDAQGRAGGLPVALGEPEGVSEGAREGQAAQPSDVVQPAAAPRVVTGPDRVVQMIADQPSGRLLMRVVDGGAEVWWVYDHEVGSFIATIGIGAVHPLLEFRYVTNVAGVDPKTGRFYVLAAPVPDAGFAGGLFVADVRRDPVPQALHFPQFAELVPPGWNDQFDRAALVVSGANTESGAPRRLFVPSTHRLGVNPSFYHVVEDRLPVSLNIPEGFGEGRTLDLDETDGVTAAAADGAARGYGARLLLVGGADAAARVGPLDPVGNAYQCNDRIPNSTDPAYPTYGPCAGGGRHVVSGALLDTLNAPRVPAQDNVVSPCTSTNRELVLGAIGVGGPAVLDMSGGRGSAEPIVTDSSLRSDLEAPASRCSGKDWQDVWSSGLFGAPPAGEPAVGWPGTERSAECVSGERESDSVGDPVGGAFAARMDCGDGEVGGFSYVRGQELGDAAKVAEALSSFRIYRDPGRGIVARIESVARGVSIDGVMRIDTVRGTAESWANGRRQPVEADGREAGYDANCDLERTAGTCFQRHLFGVRTPGYSCGPCGDEATLIDRLGRALGANGVVRLREPDEVLALGAGNGFQAGIVKPVSERFADLALNTDLLQTTLPTLEIIRYAPPNRVLTGGGPRGRQIIQLAGVEVSTSYSISCLLIYDAATNTCAEPTETPGSITVSLAEADGKPLAGGAFEVRADVDADGLLGLKDTLLPDGACVTADDGVGTCRLGNLAPGGYLVNQVAAPPGYAKSAEPFLVELASGEARTVAFTNVSSLSTIELKATDENGGPLSGAGFAAYPDPDADGKVVPDAQPAAQCTTGADGACTMQVPAGSYVLVQTSAPGGLEGIEPVAFTFASGGQTASVAVVNYPPESPQAPDAPAAPVYTPPVDVAPPIEVIEDYQPSSDSEPLPEVAPGPSVAEQVGGTVVRVIRAPGDALRLLSRDPKQAVAWTAALALFAMAALAVQRRTRLGALAYAGGPVAPPDRRPPTPPTRPNGGPRRSPSGGGSGRPASGTGLGTPGLAGGSGTVAGADQTSTGTPSGGVALDERRSAGERLVAGGAPAAVEGLHVQVVVAVAHPVVAAVVTQRLSDSPHCSVLAHVDSADALRSVLNDNQPDVLVVDLGLPTGHELDVCDLLPGLHDLARTVGLIPPNRSAEALFARGYSVGLGGMLLAEEDLTNGQLAYAVRCVAAGKPFFGPSVQALLMEGRDRIAEKARRRLSGRELEVAQLAAQGLSRIEIAERLVVSPATVKTQLRAVRSKLGITNPRDHGQVRRRLLELGLLREDTPE